MMDAVASRLTATYMLALMATLRGPAIGAPEPPTAQDLADRARLEQARRDLNSYRPLAWDEAHP